MRSPLPALVLLLLGASALGGCRSGDGVRSPVSADEMESDGWTLGASEPHASLPPGVEIVTWTRGRGATRERRSTLRIDGEDTAIADVNALARVALPLDDGSAAPAFARLAHRLGVPGIPAVGQVIEPDATLTGTGGSGRYGPADAQFWGIELEAAPRAYGGGQVVEVVLLTPPVRNEELDFESPWRIVLVREVVYPDGTLEARDTKTLTNGDDAARFARY